MNLMCPICETTDVKIKFKMARYSILYCLTCGIEFNANFPPKNSVKDSFSKEYYMELQKEAFLNQMENHMLDPSMCFYQKGLQQVAKIVKGRKLLDVGAGIGVFMKTASDAGWDVEGVEISPYGSEFIKQRYGFNVYAENLIELNLRDNSYDVITFWDSIEHMELPKRQLIKAYQLLKNGGLLLLASDNYKSLMAYLGRFIYRSSFGNITYPLERFFIPYNKTYFNHDNLSKMLKNIGYEIILLEKMQYPIEKLKLGFLEKIMLRFLYPIESFLNLHSQFTILARKNACP
jgi:2-polyprenyl-3-methyl-5-hydroxy-6-metoxy-1,4-benzoquinol methylase